MDNVAYQENKINIRRPKPTKSEQYKLDMIGLLSKIEKRKGKIETEIEECRGELLEFERDEKEVKLAIKESKIVLTDLEIEERGARIRRADIKARPQSINRRQALEKLNGELKAIKIEKNTEIKRIQSRKEELSQLKGKEKQVNKIIRERKMRKRAGGVLKFLIGAEMAAKLVNKYKGRLALVALVTVGSLNLLPKNDTTYVLPEGKPTQEIVMQEDKPSQDIRKDFIDSIKVEETISPSPTTKVEDKQEDIQNSKSEEELLGEFLENFEGGCNLEVYDIGDGVLTMGWGHTEAHNGEYQVGDKITMEQAIEFLKEDRKWAYSVVDNAALEYPDLNLKPHQRNALSSFTYNTGRWQSA